MVGGVQWHSHMPSHSECQCVGDGNVQSCSDISTHRNNLRHRFGNRFQQSCRHQLRRNLPRHIPGRNGRNAERGAWIERGLRRLVGSMQRHIHMQSDDERRYRRFGNIQLG